MLSLSLPEPRSNLDERPNVDVRMNDSGGAVMGDAAVAAIGDADVNVEAALAQTIPTTIHNNGVGLPTFDIRGSEHLA